jgi:Zn-dependent protease
VPLGVFALIFVAFSGGSKPSVLAAAALLGGVGGIVSLIVHELGHVSVAKRLSGVRPEKVSVMCLGAAAHLEGSYRNGREQARMALGGPEASFAFALALSLPVFFPAPAGLEVAALALALLNVAIGVLSLLPVHPLDGHKVVVGLVWWAVGSEERARRIIKRIARRDGDRRGRRRLRPEALHPRATHRVRTLERVTPPRPARAIYFRQCGTGFAMFS